MRHRRYPATAALLALCLALCLAWPLSAADHTARGFGAIPNDAKDDTRALQQAVDACQPGDRLVLEAGVYDLTSRITLVAKRDVEWVGQGAELVMRGYNRETDQGSFTLLTLRDCQNIRLRDFTVDQQPSRHLDGTVVAVGQDHFDLQVFPEFLPITGRERIGIMMNYRPDGTPDGRHFNTEKHDGIELLRPDTLRIRTPLARHLKTGEGIVIRSNRIDHVSLNPGSFTHSGPCAIYLRDTRGALVTGNSFHNIQLPFGQTNCSQVISTASDSANTQSSR